MSSINPFLPNGKADIVIMDGRVDKEILNNIKKFGVEIILTIKCNELYEAISYHPDVVMHPINHKTLIVAPNIFDYYKDIFADKPIKLIKGEKKLNRNYPNDIAYNVARVSRYAIHNVKYTDEKLKYYLKKEGVEFIDVKQGYSKCSIATIGEREIITSDPSIIKKCSNYDINILSIEEGFIDLPEMKHGFIGGSTGVISKDQVLFTGTYEHHPDSEKIKNFLKKYGKTLKFLSNKKIIDIGSIIPFKYN